MRKTDARGPEWLAAIAVSSLFMGAIWIVAIGAGAVGIARSDD